MKKLLFIILTLFISQFAFASEPRLNGSTDVIIRVKIVDSTTKAGKTGLAYNTSGLIISTITDNEATATTYTAAASKIETISTLGTYAAPTATKCRFKEVDSTNHKGIYEIQLANARFAVASAKELIITVSGTGIDDSDIKYRLSSFDIDSATVTPGTNSITSTVIADGALTGAKFAADGTSRGADSSTDIKLATAETYADDELNGALITIVSGTGKGQSRLVSDYTGSTDKATITPAWTTNPVNGDSKYIISSFGYVPAVVGAVGSVTGAVGSVTGAVGSLTAGGLSQTDADKVWSTSTRQLTGTQAFNLTGNITGNLSGTTGAASSVTGSVGSVAGNVVGSVGSLTAGGLSQTDADKVWSTTTRTLSDKTGFSLANSSISSSTFASGAITASVLAADSLTIDKFAAQGTSRGVNSTTDVKLATAETYADDELNGNEITIVSGTGKGQTRLITDYVASTDTATVTPAWTTNPVNADSKYIIKASAYVPGIYGTPNVNMTQIDGQATNGHNATLYLKQLKISNNTGDAVTLGASGGNGSGIHFYPHGTGVGIYGFSTSGMSELTALPGATPSLEEMIKYIYQYSRFKLTTTSGLMTMFKADSSTSLGTSTITDNGVTFTKTKVE